MRSSVQLGHARVDIANFMDSTYLFSPFPAMPVQRPDMARSPPCFGAIAMLLISLSRLRAVLLPKQPRAHDAVGGLPLIPLLL
jgi:hypothetical protein